MGRPTVIPPKKTSMNGPWQIYWLIQMQNRSYKEDETLTLTVASNTTYTTQGKILTKYLHDSTSPNLQTVLLDICDLLREKSDLVCNSEWNEPFKKLATK
jgi:hypothetical protein